MEQALENERKHSQYLIEESDSQNKQHLQEKRGLEELLEQAKKELKDINSEKILNVSHLQLELANSRNRGIERQN